MKWSTTQAASEFGVSVETVKRGLRAMNVEVVKGNRYSTKQIYAAIAGDFKLERTRSERAKANLMELEELELRKELVKMDEAEGYVRKRLMPVREAWMSMPIVLAARCNPSDPELARLALQDWCDEKMRLCGKEKE